MNIPELNAALFSAVNLSSSDLEASSAFLTNSGLFLIASDIEEITNPLDFKSSGRFIL
jgi:hypothetical protein